MLDECVVRNAKGSDEAVNVNIDEISCDEQKSIHCIDNIVAGEDTADGAESNLR